MEGYYDVLGKVYHVYWRIARIDRKNVKQLIAEQIRSPYPDLPLSPPFPIYEEQITRGLRQGTWKKYEDKQFLEPSRAKATPTES